MLGKWLNTEPSLLILDEPTRGIDVGAKAEVRQKIDALAANGMAVLLISSELPEIMGMSDRILVMRNGRIVTEFARVANSPRRRSALRRSPVFSRGGRGCRERSSQQNTSGRGTAIP